MIQQAFTRRSWLKKLSYLSLLSVLALNIACEDTGKKSAKLALSHMDYLSAAAKRDAGELTRGMPQGAKALQPLFKDAAPEKPAAVDARKEIEILRSNNRDISSAKSTFFLIAAADGTILRNNLDQDDMAGEDLFQVYPEAKAALDKDYYEFSGSWEIARGVNNRPDAQRLVSSRIVVDGQTAGLFVSGWSWSSYARRLEMALRSEILGETEEGAKVPLVYVYVIVGDQSYGTPVAPVVNGEAIVKLSPLEKTKGGKRWSGPIEITNRPFGLVLEAAPELGQNVVLAVLRTET